MKYFLIILQLMCFYFASVAQAQVAVLCYHELNNQPAEGKDIWSISSSNFEGHIRYLQQEGYRFISYAEYEQFCRGQLTLPEKSVMLTFDDGYESFYKDAYPLLQKYKVPALLAIVTSWIEGQRPTGLRPMVTWEQMREMEASGFVTIGSHTDSLHVQRRINPQGSFSSGVENYLYFGDRYETEAEYEARISNDFANVQKLFQQNLGHKAKALVWPYGRYSGKATELALQNGFTGTFLLSGGINDSNINDLHYAKRMIIYDNPDVSDLKKMLATQDHAFDKMFIAQVDIDRLYDADPAVMEGNITKLCDRLYLNKVNAVALQAFADEDGDGNVEQVYFPNSVVPVKADVFNHIANRLSQENIGVFAWMPTLSVQSLLKADGSNAVQAYVNNKKGWYKRVSPFDEEAMGKLQQMYVELSEGAYIEGVLLQDDLYLNDYEDFSAPAKAAYEKRFGVPLTETVDKASWSSFKTEQLNKVSQSLLAAVRTNRPQALTARNIYTAVVQHEKAEEWFAQNYADYLEQYDYTFLMAYDKMDKVEDTEAFLTGLVKNAGMYKNGLKKTVFKLQTYDWDKNTWINKQHMVSEIKLLKKQGAKHIAYYPETFYKINLE